MHDLSMNSNQMLKYPKVFIVRIPEKSDDDRFTSPIQHVKTAELRTYLYPMLYEQIEKNHVNGTFRILGFSPGISSMTANIWSQVNTDDLLIFVVQNSIEAFSKARMTFQSHGVAKVLWSDFSEADLRQYFITFDQISDLPPDKVMKIGSFLNFQSFTNSPIEPLDEYQSHIVASIVDELEANSLTVEVTTENQTDSLYKMLVEQYAVSRAISFFSEQGYTSIEDHGLTESYDLIATGPEGTIYIEVKGTTGDGSAITLTKNEVALHLKEFPRNALYVLSKIQIDKNSEPFAFGGHAMVFAPWKLDESCLEPLSFTYKMQAK